MSALVHRYHAVDRDSGALYASAKTVESEARADGEPPTGQQTDAPCSAASAAARHSEDFNMVEALQAEQRIFARRIRACVREEAHRCAPTPFVRGGLAPKRFSRHQVTIRSRKLNGTQ